MTSTRSRRELGWLDRWEAGAAVLRRVRYTLLLVVFAVLALFTAQGADVLRSLAEHGLSLQLVALYLGGLLWALTAWFWARIALGYEFARDPERHFPEFDAAAREWLPRLIGGAAMALLGLAIAVTGAPHAWGQATVAWILGLGLVAFVTWRRQLFAALMRGARADDIDPWPGFRHLFLSDRSLGTRSLLLLSLLVLLGMFLALTLSPVTVGQTLGTGGLFLVWAATMIPLVALADLWQRQTRFPLLTLLVAWAVLLSFFIENHDLQRVADPVGPRQQADEAFADWWIDLAAGGDGRPRDAARPVFLVASEGGGIRSAYWTAAILGELQDSDNRFGRQVFAMSGVSGGSFGLALFAAQLASGIEAAEAAEGREPLACRAISTRGGGYRQVAREMTGRDYLAPLVGSLLYPDLAQRFWPDSVESFDRARAFESAWGAAWREACGHGDGEALGNAFGADFDLQRLWHGPRATAVPHLLLNSTRVGNGQRTLVSSLAWPEDDAALGQVLDLLAVIDANPDGRDGSLPLVTAANLSARFPLVSPVGSLDVARGDREGLYRFGDGGYYENSGALTLRDLVRGIEPSLRLALGARPVIVQISNDVEAVLPPDAGPDPLLGETSHYLGELLSPLRVMLNTRSARGSEERLRLRALARQRGWPYLHFRLCDDPADAGDIEPPLGWTLSAAAQAAIDDHLSGRERCAAYGVDNAAYLEAILAALDGDFEPIGRFVPE